LLEVSSPLLEVSSPANESLVSAFSHENLGLTANVRKSGEVFEIVVIDAMSGEEVLSTHRPTQEEAEKFACCLMHPYADPSNTLGCPNALSVQMD
jgi:hypothetical protein